MFDDECNSFQEHLETISMACIPVLQVKIIKKTGLKKLKYRFLDQKLKKINFLKIFQLKNRSFLA